MFVPLLLDCPGCWCFPAQAHSQLQLAVVAFPDSTQRAGGLINTNESSEGRSRKNSVTLRVVSHWNRMPREMMKLPSLEGFKRRVDLALGNIF